MYTIRVAEVSGRRDKGVRGRITREQMRKTAENKRKKDMEKVRNNIERKYRNINNIITYLKGLSIRAPLHFSLFFFFLRVSAI